MSVVDAVTIAFSAATVILAAIAIGLAVAGWFAYRDIRINARKTAAAIAKATAEMEARKVAEVVAVREIRAYIEFSGLSAEDLSAAYRDEPPQQDHAT